MAQCIAKIAVAAATYWIDKPYDYLIPEDLKASAVPGVRVYVPFSRGNRRSEGIILSISENSTYSRLKPVSAVLDKEPVLTPEQIKLALFMRERFFCTVYDALRSMLPSGLWFDADGNQRAKNKTVEITRLCISADEAEIIADRKRLRSPCQAAILDQLCAFECLPSRELLMHSGAGRNSLLALRKAGIVELEKKEVYRRPEITAGELYELPALSEEQDAAFESLNSKAFSGVASAALLFGVTGSGKTSVYIHLIDRQLKAGRACILLVPEISLTPQMIHTFSSYFGDLVAVLHSSLSVGERFDEWKRVKSGKAKLVIGTRSAIFAPVDSLGLIIIDEEQEETYKSENSPRYDARDIAKYLCSKAGCLLVLGSATPDIISMHNAKTGKYAYVELLNRFNELPLPSVSIVDMKRELRQGNGGGISTRLADELRANIDRGEQSILFINRRGANKLITCGECGFTYKCPRCSVSLTWHSSNRRLICHYCGFSKKIDNSCPVCAGDLKYVGAGTQLIEEEIHGLFPDAGVLRMDTDTVSKAGSHEKLLEQFRDDRIPIMVGTQMVTKGLNFDNVTLVGVISADQSLYCGDYRSGERTFSLITQVVGRSGRGQKPGRAVIQTYTPENETILQAARQDYPGFYESEIELRKLQNTPPFSELLSVTVSGENEMHVYNACCEIKRRLEAIEEVRSNAGILGPAPLSVVKVNNRYRYRVLLRARNGSRLRRAVSSVIIECCTNKGFSDVSVFADNDPDD